MKYNTILFDMDGTLLDTLDDLTDSVNILLRQEKYPERKREEIRSFVGEGVKLLVMRALPDGTSEEEQKRCLLIFQEIYQKTMLNKTCPYEGIMDLLQTLKAQDIKIGVVSNKPDYATRELCKLFFPNLVDDAIGDDPARRRKPDPDNVYEILNRFHSKKEETIYVGDSNIDMQTAKNADLLSVGVTWGFRSRRVLLEEGANYIIDEPSQFIRLLEQLNG